MNTTEPVEAAPLCQTWFEAWKERVNDRELCWRRFEEAQIFHERWLHIRSGVIKPAR